MATSRGTIEEGYVSFTGQTTQTVTLTQATYGRGKVQATIVELPQSFATGSSSPANNVSDIPNNYYGTIQVSAQFINNSQFRINTTASFYGSIYWVVSS